MSVMRKYFADPRGNVAMLTAIAFVILMLFAGGAVDYIRYTTTLSLIHI